MKFGIQLYNFHELTQDLDGFENVLKKVSDIGYHYVQVSGTCEFDAEWLKEKLEKYDLECVLTHTNVQKMSDDIEKVISDHNIFGADYIGIGGMPRLWNFDEFSNDDVVDKFIEDYTEIMKKIKASGKLLMYHNHDYEFAHLKNNQTMWDALIERIPPELMGFTLDTYWIQHGGKDPEKEIRRLKGRVPCVHFKDYEIVRMARTERYFRYCPVGSGNLDWDGIIDACEFSGVKYILCEQDNSFGADPFELSKMSYDFLKSKGLKER